MHPILPITPIPRDKFDVGTNNVYTLLVRESIGEA